MLDFPKALGASWNFIDASLLCTIFLCSSQRQPFLWQPSSPLVLLMTHKCISLWPPWGAPSQLFRQGVLYPPCSAQVWSILWRPENKPMWLWLWLQKPPLLNGTLMWDLMKLLPALNYCRPYCLPHQLFPPAPLLLVGLCELLLLADLVLKSTSSSVWSSFPTWELLAPALVWFLFYFQMKK